MDIMVHLFLEDGTPVILVQENAVHMFIHYALEWGTQIFGLVLKSRHSFYIYISSLISSQTAKARPECFFHCLCPGKHVGGSQPTQKESWFIMKKDEFRKEASKCCGMFFLFQIKRVTNRNGFLCRKLLFRKRDQGTQCIRPMQWQHKTSTAATDFLPLTCHSEIYCRAAEKRLRHCRLCCG